MMVPTNPLSGTAPLSRRDMLKGAGCGFGYLAFAGLCGQLFAASSARADVEPAARSTPAMKGYQSPLLPKAPHFPARAKRVIFLFMQGGPSHLDTFDYKPKLQEDAGKNAPKGGTLVQGWGYGSLGPVAVVLGVGASICFSRLPRAVAVQPQEALA